MRVTNRLQVECQGFGGRVLQGLQRKQPDEIQESKIWRDDIYAKVRLLNRFRREGS